MRATILAAFLFAATSLPSLAEGPTTLDFILAKGVVIHDQIGGRPVDMNVTYNADGSSLLHIVGQGGKGVDLPGKWRSDGGKVCTSNQMNPVETCFDLPAGKKPGDSFIVPTARGEATLTINP